MSAMANLSGLERRNHMYAVIAGTVLAIGLVRAALLVAYTPALGYVRPHWGAGALGVAMVVAVAIITALALRRHPVASIVHALLFFLVVADPISTLWLNSLAPERYAVVSAYAVAAMVAVIALGNATRVHWSVLAIGLLLMSQGPRTLMLLPLVLAAAAWPLLKRRSRSAGAYVLLAGVVSTVLAFFLSTAAAPPEASNGVSLVPTVAVERTGSALGEMFSALARTMPAATALAPAGLDATSHGRVRRLADLPPHIMSFAALAARLPATFSMMIAMITLVTAPFAVLWLAWTARRNDPLMTAVPAVFTMLLVIAAYCFVAAVAMPEAADIARSQWLGAAAMLAAILLIPLVAWHLTADFWAGRVAVAVVFGVVLMAVGWFAWARSEAMAIGTVERVTPGASRTLQVSGWAIDPRGVKRVYATVGGGPVTEATLGVERSDLQAAYPGYPDAITGGFQMSIASNAWRENQPLRVYAENRLGAVSEIARVDVRPGP